MKGGEGGVKAREKGKECEGRRGGEREREGR